jgi:hypothetical protein
MALHTGMPHILVPLGFSWAFMALTANYRERALQLTPRDWLTRDAKLAAAIVALLALSLLRNGTAGVAT